MADVLGYLNSKGLTLKRGDAKNVHTACMFCQEDPSSRGRLYINIDDNAEIPGLLFCHRCQHKGNLVTLKHFFGDSIAEDEMDFNIRSEILALAAGYYHEQLLKHFDDVSAYLKGPKRGLYAETIAAHLLGYACMEFRQEIGVGTSTRRPRALYEFLQGEGYTTKAILATGLCQKATDRDAVIDALGGMVTIPYHVAGNVSAIRGRSWPFDEDDWDLWEGERYPAPKGKYKTCGGTSARLFNTDSTWDRTEVTLSEGEFDCLILEQNGYPSIGVPGANAWQDAWDGYVKELKRVWLVFDRDAAGESAARKLVDRFGSKVRRIFLSGEGVKCDPTTWFGEGHTAAEFDALIVEARRGGILITVDEALHEFDQCQGQQGLSFNWEMFDTMIRPGLMAGQVMIILSKTNGGKTVLLLNLMHRMRMVAAQKNLRILFVSLEQTRGEWWDRARRIHSFYDLDATEDDAANFWRDQIMIIDRNRVKESDLRQAIDDFEYEIGKPDVIFVDYLGYWARSFRGEAYERTSEAVMTLKGIAKDYRVPIITPHQVSRGAIDGQEFGAESSRDAGVVEETGDFVLPMWSPDNQMGREAEERSGRIHLRIAKSRHGGRGVLLTMQFAPISLVMVPEHDPLCARARKEYGWVQQYRDDWPRALHRHRTGDEGHLEPYGDGFRLTGKPPPPRGW